MFEVRQRMPDDTAAVRRLTANLRRWFSLADLRAIDVLLKENVAGWVAHNHSDGDDNEDVLVGFLLTAPTPDPLVREVATRAFYHARGFVDRRTDRDYYWPGGDRLLLRRIVATGQMDAVVGYGDGASLWCAPRGGG